MANSFAIPGPESKYKLQNAKPAGLIAGVWHAIIAPITVIVSVFNNDVSVYETNNHKYRYNLGFVVGIVSLYLPAFAQGYNFLATVALLIVIWQATNLFLRERKLTEMNKKLEETNQALSDSVQALFEVNLELKEKTKDLEAANLKIQEATRHKSEFLANMSHELRTPMNAIMGFTRLVIRKGSDVLPPLQVTNLQKIMESADHLLALINDVLDISKIEAGKTEMIFKEFSLHNLIRSCVDTIKPLVKEGVSIEVTLDEEVNKITSDVTRVKQIITNLLSNAAKFTEKGKITVNLQATNSGLEVSVTDTGIGIPEDFLEKIFDEFRQVDQTTTRHYGGTGLGLSISRKLARMLNGDVKVVSTIDKGSTFILELPLEKGQ
jgi:signal transduction histidine kinase